jgi:hypothetical protein
MFRKMVLLVVFLGLSSLQAPSPTQAAGRQSFFGLTCSAGMQATLMLTIVYEHGTTAAYNTCTSGSEATRPWVFPTFAEGNIKSLTATVVIRKVSDESQEKTCTMTNGAQSLFCQLEAAGPSQLPPSVVFAYDIAPMYVP